LDEEKFNKIIEAFKHNVEHKFPSVLYYNGTDSIHLTTPRPDGKVGIVEVHEK